MVQVFRFIYCIQIQYRKFTTFHHILIEANGAKRVPKSLQYLQRCIFWGLLIFFIYLLFISKSRSLVYANEMLRSIIILLYIETIYNWKQPKYLIGVTQYSMYLSICLREICIFFFLFFHNDDHRRIAVDNNLKKTRPSLCYIFI